MKINISIILLLISTLIWGFGFVAAKMGLERFDAYWSVALRFLIAGILGLPLLIFKYRTFTDRHAPLKEGVIAGSLLFGMLLFQTIGIGETTIAKSGFFTTLYTLFVPLIMIFYQKKKLHWGFGPLILMAMIGVMMLCHFNLSQFNRGDLMIVICSIFASLHIIYIGEKANAVRSAIEFNFIQNVAVGVFATLFAIVKVGTVDFTPLLDYQSDAFLGLAFLAIISSMFAFTIQVVAQRNTPPHIASLIFLLESPFAALFGFFIYDERLSKMGIMGAVLIFASVSIVPLLEQIIEDNGEQIS